jgi:ribose 5-phosphate isomerase B
MKVAVGADGLGVELKQRLLRSLEAAGHEGQDHGCDAGEDVDYPDVAVTVAQAVAQGRADRGVLICGTGIGMAIAANKVRGVRAANVADVYSAERAMRSNDARILCLGALVTGPAVAERLLQMWMQSTFDGGRSARKVDKIAALDGGTTQVSTA